MSMYDEAIDLIVYYHVNWKWLFNGNGWANALSSQTLTNTNFLCYPGQGSTSGAKQKVDLQSFVLEGHSKKYISFVNCMNLQ